MRRAEQKVWGKEEIKVMLKAGIKVCGSAEMKENRNQENANEGERKCRKGAMKVMRKVEMKV